MGGPVPSSPRRPGSAAAGSASFPPEAALPSDSRCHPLPRAPARRLPRPRRPGCRKKTPGRPPARRIPGRTRRSLRMLETERPDLCLARGDQEVFEPDPVDEVHLRRSSTARDSAARSHSHPRAILPGASRPGAPRRRRWPRPILPGVLPARGRQRSSAGKSAWSRISNRGAPVTEAWYAAVSSDTTLPPRA